MKNIVDVFSGKSRGGSPSDVVMAFVQSWDRHGSDESTLGSMLLDVLRVYWGERPMSLWKKSGAGLTKISERGLVDVYFSNDQSALHLALSRAILSGTSEFDTCDMTLPLAEEKFNFDGFLHVPVPSEEDVIGVLTVAVKKKEARDRNLVQPLECLARLVGIALGEIQNRSKSQDMERRLKSEITATSRELENTNAALIQRVKELKTLSSELEKKVVELTHANNAKDEFLSIVSHELRTPLTSLNGFLCVLLDEEGGPMNETQKKFLGIAKSSADRLNLLIADLLDISRIETGHLSLDMKVCSIFDILMRSLEGLKKTAEIKTIKLRFEGNPALPTVFGDANRLQQVIDNLIGNAIKFTEAGGNVILDAQPDQQGVMVSVKDTGPGLAPDDQKKVFDMFYQVDASSRRKAGGAGLGLAIAHGIIALHGGRLWVESELGKGSTFKFLLPKAAPAKAS